MGAGYQWTRLDSLSSVGVTRPFVVGTNNQQGAFAFQGILGASFPIPNVPGLSLTTDYRFMDILGGEKYNSVSGAGGVLTPAVLKLHNQYDHELVVGVRYAFNAPAPAAPPMAPAPVAVKGNKSRPRRQRSKACSTPVNRNDYRRTGPNRQERPPHAAGGTIFRPLFIARGPTPRKSPQSPDGATMPYSPDC